MLRILYGRVIQEIIIVGIILHLIVRCVTVMRLCNQVSIHKDVMYVSFEDAMKVATNIMVGEYLGRSSSGCDGYEYRVLTQIKGRVDDDKICLHAEKHSVDVVGTDISYISDLQCDVGKTYMLVATRNVSVYQEHDIYIPVADIYIPLENVTGSTMYGQETFM